MTTDTSFSYSATVISMTNARRIAMTLLLGDFFGIILCFEGSYFVRFGNLPGGLNLASLGITAAILLGFYIADAYRPDLQSPGLGAPVRTLITCLLIGVVLAVLSYLFNGKTLTPFVWRSILLPGLGLFTVWAVVLRLLANQWAESNAKQSSCLFLGDGCTTLQFEQDFIAWNPLAKLVILSNGSDLINEPANKLKYLAGILGDLSHWSSYPWSGIVVASHLELSKPIIQQLMHLRLKGTPIYRLPDFYELLWQKLPPALLQDDWFAFGDGFHLPTNRANLKLKRLIDLGTASFLLLLLSPLMMVTALAIRAESPGAIFYSQWRNGLNGKPFRVYKFRSMYQDAEKQGAQWAQKRDPRVTQVGYWLRLVRIDELPQLWNVLQGNMSLIGPRPERPEFDSQLSAEIPYYTLRYLVKPGITGWAQVLYPYGASVEDAYEKLSYDLYYIKNYSIWLDLAIGFKTVGVVLLGKGR